MDVRAIRKSFIVSILLSIFIFYPVYYSQGISSDQPPFFSISILVPNVPTYVQLAAFMAEQLPRIGIDVETIDVADWSEIDSRIFYYPGSNSTPTYDEGGYDIFFMGWSHGFDFDPSRQFATSSMRPYGFNIYQYSSQAMDWAIDNYTSSFMLADRLKWVHEIQYTLYDDLPQISIIYESGLYVHHPDLIGWDGTLFYLNAQPMESWNIPGVTTFKYATPTSFEDFHVMHYDSIHDAQWLRQIYNGLVERYVEEPYSNSFGPRLADSFSSDDGITYNIVIKDDACWADGTDLTAYDIQYNYQLIIDPDFNHPDYSYWVKFLNNESVNVINDKELTITFKQAFTFHDSNLGVDLIPKHIWEEIAPEDQKMQAAIWAVNEPNKLFGAGPYKLAEYEENEIIHLVRNDYFDDWSGVTPSFEDIYFIKYANSGEALSAVAAGTVHMVDTQFSPQIAQVPTGAAYTLFENGIVGEIAINMLHPILGTGEHCPIAGPDSAKYIRRAISCMIPRWFITQEIFKGLAVSATTAMPSISIGYSKILEPYDYDIQLAKTYMTYALGFNPWFHGYYTYLDFLFGFLITISLIFTIGPSIIISIVITSVIAIVKKKRKFSATNEIEKEFQVYEEKPNFSLKDSTKSSIRFCWHCGEEITIKQENCKRCGKRLFEMKD